MTEEALKINSTESLCTDIETLADKTDLKKNTYTFSTTHTDSKALNSSEADLIADCDNSNTSDVLKIVEPFEEENLKTKEKYKKTVSFNPDDEKVRKFITGEPIIDKKNPFKNANALNSSSTSKSKKTPPPVPAKRSTLSIRKTVTQQLREREYEKEKERERSKNKVNACKNNSISIKQNGTADDSTLNSPDEYITTEEVLNQSKYVKTYIKNPDPYFVYDPNILARIKFEELREITGRKPKRKVTTNGIQENGKTRNINAKVPTFKKCSKPNYPELGSIKIKVGTESDGNYFNPAEVTKNVKKFDERVKKLNISSDDDLDEIEEPLTKSESSDDLVSNTTTLYTNEYVDINDKNVSPATTMPRVVNENKNENENDNKMASKGSAWQYNENEPSTPESGTFTNTIKSKEFQAYLERKGLTLMPKNETYVAPKQKISFTFPNEEKKSNSACSIPYPQKDQVKKLSVFQRLLSNSIFAARRKTTPKEIVPTPISVSIADKGNSTARTTPSALKRVALERQSYHGLSRSDKLLGSTEEQYFRQRNSNTRDSFASDANYSLPKSNNAPLWSKADDKSKLKTFPKTTTAAASKTMQSSTMPTTANKSNISTNNCTIRNLYMPRKTVAANEINESSPFQRSLERQSLIPRRITGENNRLQTFGRSASMDRYQILKRTAERGLQNKSQSENSTFRFSLASDHNDEKQVEKFLTANAPNATSTPIRDVNGIRHTLENPLYNPTTMHSSQTIAKPATMASTSSVYVDQNEWEQLRAIKEHTDRQLYYKVLAQQQQQQQKRQQSAENVYEPLHTLPREGHFIRGSAQRNTFSGGSIAQMKPTKYTGRHQPTVINEEKPNVQVRCQSIMDGMISQRDGSQSCRRRDYESQTEAAVILRNKERAQTHRIGGILTREEILERVKEFCRKSLNKTSGNQHKMQVIVERQNERNVISTAAVHAVNADLQQLSASQNSTCPKAPLHLQSLPQERVLILDANNISSSPVYAHVAKRSSIQSNHTDLYDTPQQIISRQHAILEPTQYVIVDNIEQLSPVPAHFINYAPNPIYGRQPVIYRSQPTDTNVRMQRIIQDNNYRALYLHNGGRNTPLILDSSSQQASQIYWSPQHQRLQQANLLPMQISPRCIPIKQTSYPLSPTEFHNPNHTVELVSSDHLNFDLTIPTQSQLCPTVVTNSFRRKPQPQQQKTLKQLEIRNTSDWDSGSEASEIRRIIEQA